MYHELRAAATAARQKPSDGYPVAGMPASKPSRELPHRHGGHFKLDLTCMTGFDLCRPVGEREVENGHTSRRVSQNVDLDDGAG